VTHQNFIGKGNFLSGSSPANDMHTVDSFSGVSRCNFEGIKYWTKNLSFGVIILLVSGVLGCW
jgi:hypothetical protein